MARLFDDVQSEYLEVNSGPVAGEPFALAVWFYSDDDAADQTVLSVGIQAAPSSFHRIRLRGDAAGDRVHAQSFINGGASGQAISTAGYAASMWHHAVALFVADNDRRILLDGGNKGTDVVNVVLGALDRAAVGVTASSWHGEYMSGRVAEAAVWNLTNWPGATSSDKADAFEAIAVPSLAGGYSPAFFMLGLEAYYSLIRDEDQDRVGGHDMTAFNAPSIAAHPPMIYPAPLSFFMVPGAPAGSFRDLLGMTLGLSSAVETRVAPESRTFDVLAEVRAFDVVAEDRVFVVEAE